jgi:hypothetical protein
MRVRTATLCIAAAPALVIASFAHASGYADPDYPQMSHSTMSRDAVAAEAMRANNSMHATEVLESQVVKPPSAGADRAQVQAEAVRANNSMHPTEVLESQVAAARGVGQPACRLHRQRRMSRVAPQSRVSTKRLRMPLAAEGATHRSNSPGSTTGFMSRPMN